MTLPEGSFYIVPKDKDGVYLVKNTLCRRDGICERFSNKGSLKRCEYYRVFGNEKSCNRGPNTVERLAKIN